MKNELHIRITGYLTHVNRQVFVREFLLCILSLNVELNLNMISYIGLGMKILQLNSFSICRCSPKN